ncbi:uncharacterized protein METZ01_LOCUS85734, partial [marine metagenome]
VADDYGYGVTVGAHPSARPQQVFATA